MNFLRLIRRFVPPYKGQMALNILFNLLSTVLSLFSFAAIIPVLQLLFGLSEASAVYTDLATVSGLNATLDALKGNLYFYMEQLSRRGGVGSIGCLPRADDGAEMLHRVDGKLLHGAHPHGRVARP